MKHMLASFILAGLGIPAALAAPAPTPARHAPHDHVYLDDSATYEAIRQGDPRRYEKIVEVLRVAEVEPCQTLPQVLKTKLEVDARCHGYVVYTSFPAKTRLNFTIDDTDYTAYVVQKKLSAGKLIPAK